MSRTPRIPSLISIIRRMTRLMLADLVRRLEAEGYRDVMPGFDPVFANIDETGTRLTDLAARAGMTHQSMGELVGLLEQRGYVERRPDPADRRARLVCFTARGRQLFEAGNAHLRAIEADWQRRWRNVGLPPGMTAKLAQALEAAENELAQQ